MEEKVILNEQDECYDGVDNYDFSIPMVVTPNLIRTINELGKLPIEKVLFIAHCTLLEAHNDNSHIDYFQTFSYCGVDFWCISNKLKDEPYNPNIHILTWLRPEDY